MNICGDPSFSPLLGNKVEEVLCGLECIFFGRFRFMGNSAGMGVYSR
jgi:hypothetical protein